MGAISELQQTVDTFVTEYRRDRTVQNAFNELTEAKSELEQSFGRHKEVRELAADIIFIVDSGYIRRSVIVDATERLAIRTPRYWLAPAVVAVAAWLKDDEGLYLDSISSALNLDPGKTALFMILLLRHQERAGAMGEWIGRVPGRARADQLADRFAVILEAAENTQNKHQRFDSVQITLGKRHGTYSCATAAEVTPDALRRQAEDVAEELAGEIDYEVSQRGKKLRRRASGWLVTAGVVSCGLLAAAFSGPVTRSLQSGPVSHLTGGQPSDLLRHGVGPERFEVTLSAPAGPSGQVGVLAQSPSRSRGRRPHRRRPIDTGAAGKMAPVGPALRAAGSVADAQTATMVLRPFRIEDLETTRPWTVRENRRQIRSAVGGGTGANVVRRRPADVDLRRRTGTAAVNRGPVAWPVCPAARLGRGWHKGQVNRRQRQGTPRGTSPLPPG